MQLWEVSWTLCIAFWVRKMSPATGLPPLFALFSDPFLLCYLLCPGRQTRMWLSEKWITGPQDLGDFYQQMGFNNQWDEELFWELNAPYGDAIVYNTVSIITTITNWYTVLDKYWQTAFQKCCIYIFAVPSLPHRILFLFCMVLLRYNWHTSV